MGFKTEISAQTLCKLDFGEANNFENVLASGPFWSQMLHILLFVSQFKMCGNLFGKYGALAPSVKHEKGGMSAPSVCHSAGEHAALTLLEH